MATGALIFVDAMHTPMPYPPIDGEHIVVYDNSDEQGLSRRGAMGLPGGVFKRPRFDVQMDFSIVRLLQCATLTLSSTF
jgi:hypothetical protein